MADMKLGSEISLHADVALMIALLGVYYTVLPLVAVM
jgi:hypothetical protein